MNQGFFSVFRPEDQFLDISYTALSLIFVCFLVGSKATSQPRTGTSQ